MNALNQIIKFTERFLSFLLNLVWVPAFIAPPENTAVDFITTDYYVLAGNYRNGSYKLYPAKYKKVYGWRYRGMVSLPKFSVRKVVNVPTILFNPKTDHVWEYRDGQGKQHWVTHNTRKAMEANPFHTTLSGKRKKIEENKQNR